MNVIFSEQEIEAQASLQDLQGLILGRLLDHGVPAYVKAGHIRVKTGHLTIIPNLLSKTITYNYVDDHEILH